MTQNSNNLDSALVAAITETVESIAFEEAVVIDEETHKTYPEKNLLWSQVPVIAPAGGSISLQVPCGLPERFGQDVYNLHEESREDWKFDVLGEMLNTIAGSFMKRIYPDRQFQIGIPEIGTGPGPKADNTVSTVQLNVGDYFLTAQLCGSQFDDFVKA